MRVFHKNAIAMMLAAGFAVASAPSFAVAEGGWIDVTDGAYDYQGLTQASDLKLEYKGEPKRGYGGIIRIDSVAHSDVNLDINSFEGKSTNKGIVIAGNGATAKTVAIKTKDDLSLTSDHGHLLDFQGAGAINLIAGQDLSLNSPGAFAVFMSNTHEPQSATLSAGRDLHSVSLNGFSNNGSNALKIQAERNIDITTKSHYGLISMGSGGIDLAAKGDVKITSPGDSVVKSGNGSVKISGANVELNFTEENKNKPGAAIVVGASDVVILSAGKTVVNGDINATNSGHVSIVFNGAESVLNGAIQTRQPVSVDSGQTAGPASALNANKIVFSNGATWTPDANSHVDNLTVDNGKIDTNGKDVTVDQLSGTQVTVAIDPTKEQLGSFTVGAVAPEQKPDITVDMVQTSDSVNEEMAKHAMQQVKGAGVTGEGAPKIQGVVQEGLNNGKLVLDSNGMVSRFENTVMRDTLDLTTGVVLSFNRILMNDTRKRMGDLRQATGDYGAWVRYDGGRLTGEKGLENDFNTVQLGFDTKLSALPEWRLGVAAAYTEGEADFRRGNVDTDAYSVALYGVWMPAGSGLYVDLIGRYSEQKGDMTIDADKKADADSTAFSFSGELGYHHNVTDAFYVEPQVELAYSFIESDDVKLTGARYVIDDTESLMSRFGVAFGYQLAKSADFYARFSALHEFMGETALHSTGASITADGNDTWFEFALGGNLMVCDNAYIWADVERTDGANIEEDWRATVGARWNF